LGESPFSGGPPLVWYVDGQFTLITQAGSSSEIAAFQEQPNCSHVSYPGYTIEQPIRGANNLETAFRQALQPALTKAQKIGVEINHLPAYLWQVLNDMLPAGSEIVALDGKLVPLRKIKTGEEITKLRANFALTDIGHAAAREAVQAGRREIDVWTDIHRAVQQAAGRRVPLGNDCVVGYRQANIGGWPGALEIREGDSVIVDLSTIMHGYWSDSCATYYAGERSPKQAAIHQTITNALDYAINLVKPGVVARDLDRQVRQFIADAGYAVYPHHTGHGVGVTGHEAPRIVPYNDEVLEEGMVIMLEPGIYLPGETGVRLEDALLITADGAEILTGHDKS
jgi:Xaa-Pro aminopeptidase